MELVMPSGGAKEQPRASRHYPAAHAWHITHGYHKKEFLLKCAQDRQGWLNWLFEARKRYRIVILGNMAASSHIHLLIHDRDGGEVIPKSVPTGGGVYCAGIQSDETQHNTVSGLALEW